MQIQVEIFILFVSNNGLFFSDPKMVQIVEPPHLPNSLSPPLHPLIGRFFKIDKSNYGK